MKFPVHCTGCTPFPVAPLAGAWIEMDWWGAWQEEDQVAPLAGAWIEIMSARSLKYGSVVAPLAGAWIEIVIAFADSDMPTSRSPRGSVD